SELQRYLAWSISAAGRARRTARFHPRRRWCLPRVAGGKPLLRSGRRDACRGGLSSHLREDRGILHLRRGGRLPGRWELLGSRSVGLAIDSASSHHFMMTPPDDALIAYALPDTK